MYWFKQIIQKIPSSFCDLLMTWCYKTPILILSINTFDISIQYFILKFIFWRSQWVISAKFLYTMVKIFLLEIFLLMFYIPKLSKLKKWVGRELWWLSIPVSKHWIILHYWVTLWLTRKVRRKKVLEKIKTGKQKWPKYGRKLIWWKLI